MGVMGLFEIGFFEAFWNFSNWILSLLVYLCVLIGFVIQTVLLKKCRAAGIRWSFIAFMVIGIVSSECAYQVITGWDSLFVLIIYGFIICCLIGAVLASAVRMMIRKRRHEKG